MKSIPIRSQCTCPCHHGGEGVIVMHATPCCIPDELAPQPKTQPRWSGGFCAYDGHMCAPCHIMGPDNVSFWVAGAQRKNAIQALDNVRAAALAENADKIETLRAQLAAATRRAEQLEAEMAGHDLIPEGGHAKAIVRAEQAERMLAEAVDAMSGLSSYLGAGMGDAATTAQQYDSRIRWGIDHIGSVYRTRAAQVVEECSKRPKTTWGQVKRAILDDTALPTATIRSAASGEQG